MTLAIHDNYRSYNEKFWERNIPAFDCNTHQLTTVSSGSSGVITDLEQISQKVNSLAKPIFRNVDEFYNIFRNIEKINEFMKKRGVGTLINTRDFVPCLRPTTSELKNRLWAVHVSDHLWPDAVMVPFQKTLGSTAPHLNISLTVHFSLGEMVRPHSKIYNWKYRDLAILTPLADLSHQLAGIYPYDTFVHGLWKITPKSILIVPPDIAIPEAYSKLGLKIVTYNPRSTSLRTAVKQEITAQQGISLKMSRNLLCAGSPAYLFGNSHINVNSPEFFESLLEENRELSYGTDTESQNNRLGYCFGLIRQMSNQIVTYAAINPPPSTLKETYGYLELAFEKITDRLTPQERTQITNFLSQYHYLSQFSTEEGSIKTSTTDITCNLNFRELQEFKIKHPYLFTQWTEHITDAEWAITRWLMLGKQRGSEENLEDIYRQSITKFLSQEKMLLTTAVTDTIAKYLEGQSERAELVLYILNLPETRAYNCRVAQQYIIEKRSGKNIIANSCSFFLFNYKTDSIESALSAYSNIVGRANVNLRKAISDTQKFLADPNPLESEELYISTKLPPIKLEKDAHILKNSYAHFDHSLMFTPHAPYSHTELYETKMKDLESLPVSVLLFRKPYPAHKLWREFNLEQEFNQMFPNDQLFWTSENTFVEIYRKLKAMQGINVVSHGKLKPTKGQVLEMKV